MKVPLSPEKEIMGGEEKASRPKGSVAGTRERKHVNIVSRVHGRVGDAGSSRGRIRL